MPKHEKTGSMIPITKQPSWPERRESKAVEPEESSPYAKWVEDFWARKNGRIEIHIYNAAQTYFRRQGDVEGFDEEVTEFREAKKSIEAEIEDYAAMLVIDGWITAAEKRDVARLLIERTAEAVPEIVAEARVAF